jgi:hypothetical protein
LTGEQQTSEVGAGIAHGVVRGGRVVPVRGGGRVLRVSGIFLGTA